MSTFMQYVALVLVFAAKQRVFNGAERARDAVTSAAFPADCRS